MRLPGIIARAKSPSPRSAHSDASAELPTLLTGAACAGTAAGAPEAGAKSSGSTATSSGSEDGDGQERGCGSEGPSKGSSFNSALSEFCLGREDFEALELIGCGSFGEVKLVRCKRDDRLYAMKAVEKALLRERRLHGDVRAMEQIKRERDVGVLARRWRCPFLIELFASFQTAEKLYFVYEFCPGGELWHLLREHPDGRFPESVTRFYLAEVVLALAHLHAHDVIHRDVKLENVLLAADGHVRLADFGCANPHLPQSGTRSFLLVGRPEVFMPPEFHRDELYGKDLDCWQLGVVAFLMIAGAYPEARGAGEDDGGWPGELPDDASGAAAELCGALLERDRARRLGFPSGAGLVRDHRFFGDLDWEALEAKAVEPPVTVPEFEDTGGGIPLRQTLKGRSPLLRVRGFSFASWPSF